MPRSERARACEGRVPTTARWKEPHRGDANDLVYVEVCRNGRRLGRFLAGYRVVALSAHRQPDLWAQRAAQGSGAALPGRQPLTGPLLPHSRPFDARPP